MQHPQPYISLCPMCCHGALPAFHQLAGSGWSAPRLQVAVEFLTPAVGAAECFGVSESILADPVINGLWHQSHQAPKLGMKVPSLFRLALGSPLELGSALLCCSDALGLKRLAHGARAALIWSLHPFCT